MSVGDFVCTHGLPTSGGVLGALPGSKERHVHASPLAGGLWRIRCDLCDHTEFVQARHGRVETILPYVLVER